MQVDLGGAVGRRIEVVPHDTSWSTAFEDEKRRLWVVFDPIVERVHHVGSTSVPGLLAKPVIDLLVVVRDDSSITDFDEDMKGLGYKPRGECLDAGGTPGRFYYSRTVDGVRTHQAHVCRVGHFQVDELLWFVRYLSEHGDVAEAYGRLKLEAADAYEFDNPGYMARKHAWIRSTLRAARACYSKEASS